MNDLVTRGLQPASEVEQARFFNQFEEGFALARARVGETVRDFRVAGTSIRLRFAGDALVPIIVPGLSGPISGIEPGAYCEICLWDSESTGIRGVPAPRPWVDFTGKGNIWGFESARYRSAYQWSESSVSVMDREARRAAFWVRSAKQLPPWVLAAPLRSILHWWMELNGRQLVHAAAVGHGGHALLLPGRGGSGKSSTSLACLVRGLDFVSDDYLAVALDPQPRVHRLYSTAKLAPERLGLYPEITARCRTVHEPGFDKVVVFLEDGFRDQLKQSLPLKLLLKPRISGLNDTTLGPAEPLDIERALASETLLHLPHSGAHTVEFLDRLSHEIPCASIQLGTDNDRLVAAIQNALSAPISAGLPKERPPKLRPFVSIVVHFREETPGEMRNLADAIDAQAYPRKELLVAVSGAAYKMKDDVTELAGQVRVLPFDQPVGNGQAWNRGIRESFAELVIFIEPGDRFPDGALAALVNASDADPNAAWYRGKIERWGERSLSPLRGALIRRSAFRECGLFPLNFHFQGREQVDWLERANEKGLTGRRIESPTLTVTQDAPPLIVKPDLRLLRAQLARSREPEID